MSIKQAGLPKKHIVIRDLKRGEVLMEFKKDPTLSATLSNMLIPDNLMAETNPNNPLELEEVHCFNMERRRWDKFKISELTYYHPSQGEVRGKSKGRKDAEDPKGTGHHSPEAPQET